MTVAAAIESGVGGGSGPGLGSASGRVAGKTSESAGTGAAPASSTTSTPQAAQSFRSNWQAQMAVFADEMDGEMGGPSSGQGMAEGSPDAAGEGAAAPGTPWTQSGSVLSMKTTGTQKSVSPPAGNAVAAVTVTNARTTRTWAGSRAPSLIQTPVAAPVLATAAPLQSAKAASADEANGAKVAPSAKAQKQPDPVATNLSSEAPTAFTAGPIAAIVQPEAGTLPAVGSPVPADPFNGLMQIGSFFNSQVARGETGIAKATAVQPTAIAAAQEPQQLHDKISSSYSN
jgi:hypothetical protein